MKCKINLVTGLLSVIIVVLICSQVKIRSEFASGLSDLIGIVFSIFAALLIYAIYYAISCIDRLKTETTIQMIISCICLALITFSCYHINHYKPKSKTKEEVREFQLKKLNRMMKKGNKMLAKNKNRITDYAVLKEDSTAIIKHFNHFLDSAFYRNSDSLRLDYSSTFSRFFNRNLTRYTHAELLTDTVNTNKYRQIIKNSLSIDFFSYSPDNSKLFIIMTYEIGEEPTGANALALIGERKDNKLILYRHICGFQNNYSVVNKQYALYGAIIDFAQQGRPCGITNPLEKSFWNSKWFEKNYVNGTETYRYQLDYSLDKVKYFIEIELGITIITP